MAESRRIDMGEFIYDGKRFRKNGKFASFDDVRSYIVAMESSKEKEEIEGFDYFVKQYNKAFEAHVQNSQGKGRNFARNCGFFYEYLLAYYTEQFISGLNFVDSEGLLQTANRYRQVIFDKAGEKTISLIDSAAREGAQKIINRYPNIKAAEHIGKNVQDFGDLKLFLQDGQEVRIEIKWQTKRGNDAYYWRPNGNTIIGGTSVFKYAKTKPGTLWYTEESDGTISSLKKQEWINNIVNASISLNKGYLPDNIKSIRSNKQWLAFFLSKGGKAQAQLMENASVIVGTPTTNDKGDLTIMFDFDTLLLKQKYSISTQDKTTSFLLNGSPIATFVMDSTAIKELEERSINNKRRPKNEPTLQFFFKLNIGNIEKLL